MLSQARATAATGGASSRQQPPPRFRTETNLVRVDVYATKDGVPVQDLKADDFEVFEDNAPQKIDSFEHIVVHDRRAAGAARPSPRPSRRRTRWPPIRGGGSSCIYLDTEHVGCRGIARDQGAADRVDDADDGRRRSGRRS